MDSRSSLPLPSHQCFNLQLLLAQYPRVRLLWRAGTTARPGARPRNAFEVLILSLDQHVAGLRPTIDEDLAKRFRRRGYAKKDIPQAIKGYDARRDEMMRQRGAQILMMGYVRLLPWSRCDVIQGKSKKGNINFELYPAQGLPPASEMPVWHGVLRVIHDRLL